MARIETLETSIEDVRILEPQVFSDARGFFLETFNEREMEKLGIPHRFVQDNQSHSVRHVLRGLHYQLRQPQGKLVRAVRGEIFDVAVDLRRRSATFGQWTGASLSSANMRMLWIPPGFAHGFVVLSDTADVLYKATDFYAPEWERTLLWNDSDIAIQWPIGVEPILSDKDRAGLRLRDAELFQ